MHAQQVDIASLAEKLRKKRENRSLRVVAKEADVSFSTLSRVEQGRIPDLETFAKICAWLKVPPNTFLPEAGNIEQGSNEERICAHLRADRTLAPGVSQALISMVQAAYKNLGEISSGKRHSKPSKTVP